MSQSIFEKIDEFGWWDLEIISADAGTQFIYTESQGECKNHGVNMPLAAPWQQEMYGSLKVK